MKIRIARILIAILSTAISFIAVNVYLVVNNGPVERRKHTPSVQQLTLGLRSAESVTFTRGTKCGWILLDGEQSTHKSFNGRAVKLPPRSKEQFTLVWAQDGVEHVMFILPFYNGHELFGVAPDLSSIDCGSTAKPISRDYVRKVLTAEGIPIK